MWPFLTFLLMLSLSTMCAALPDDPLLDKPVTLAVKGESLSDIVEMLQKQTGVSLSTSRGIADQKATIFVDEQPLRNVMNGLTTLFQYTWRRWTVGERVRYELLENRERRKEEEARREQAREEAWKSMQRQIGVMSELSSLSKDEINQMAEDAVEYFESLSTAPHESFTDEVPEHYLKMIERGTAAIMLAYDPFTLPLLNIYNKLSSQAIEALRSGHRIYFDSASPEPEWRIPFDILNELVDASLSEPNMQSGFDSEIDDDSTSEDRGSAEELDYQPPDEVNVGLFVDDSDECLTITATSTFRTLVGHLQRSKA